MNTSLGVTLIWTESMHVASAFQGKASFGRSFPLCLFSDCVVFFPWEFLMWVIMLYICDYMITHVLLRKTWHHKIPLYVTSVRQQPVLQYLLSSWLNAKHDFQLAWSTNTRMKVFPFRWSLIWLKAPSALYPTRYLEWIVKEETLAEPFPWQKIIHSALGDLWCTLCHSLQDMLWT